MKELLPLSVLAETSPPLSPEKRRSILLYAAVVVTALESSINSGKLRLSAVEVTV